jgi:hypothetical protein
MGKVCYRDLRLLTKRDREVQRRHIFEHSRDFFSSLLEQKGSRISIKPPTPSLVWARNALILNLTSSILSTINDLKLGVIEISKLEF